MKVKIPYSTFFKRNEDRIVIISLLTVFLPFTLLGVAVAFMLFIICALVWAKRRAVGPRIDPKLWFAWYPVNVKSSVFDKNDYRWLEFVKRSLSFERKLLYCIGEMDADIIYRPAK